MSDTLHDRGLVNNLAEGTELRQWEREVITKLACGNAETALLTLQARLLSYELRPPKYYGPLLGIIIRSLSTPYDAIKQVSQEHIKLSDGRAIGTKILRTLSKGDLYGFAIDFNIRGHLGEQPASSMVWYHSTAGPLKDDQDVSIERYVLKTATDEDILRLGRLASRHMAALQEQFALTYPLVNSVGTSLGRPPRHTPGDTSVFRNNSQLARPNRRDQTDAIRTRWQPRGNHNHTNNT